MYNENPADEPEKTDTFQAGQNKEASPLSAAVKRAAVIALIIFLLILVIGFMSARSIPGDTFYAMKTNVLEALNGAVMFGTNNKAEYQVALLENRFEEVQQLALQDSVDEGSLALLYDQVGKHRETLFELVQKESSDFSMEDRLFVLNNFASVAGAMEAISENDPKLSAFGDQMEDVRRETVNLYKDTAEVFASSGNPQAALEFIKTSLSEVSEKLNNPEVSREAIDDAETYIDRTALAIKDRDYVKAINSVGEASRFIKIEEYTGVMPVAVRADTATSSAGTSSPSSAESGTSTATSS